MSFSSVLASEPSHGGGGGFTGNGSLIGFNNWSLEDKARYWATQGYFFCGSLLGLYGTDTDDVWYQTMLMAYPQYDTLGCRDFPEYLSNHVSFDDDTQSFVIDNEMTNLCNAVVEEHEEKTTMVYRYPISPPHISAESFPSKAIYQAVVDLCKQCPDAYFWFPSREMNQNLGWGRFYIDGERIDFNYDHDDLRNGWIRLFAYDGVFAGVNEYPTLNSTSVSLYNEGWERIIDNKLFLIRAISSTEYQICYCTSLNDFYMVSDLESFDISNVPYIMHNWFIEDKVAYLTPMRQESFSNGVFYSASNQALNVYRSVADMKKDIGSQVVGGYTPNYTGQVKPSSTVVELNNYIDTYYPDYVPPSDGGGNSGSGDGDGGSGSSGGGFFDSIAKLFGTLGDGIAKIVEVLIKPLTKIIDLFVGLVEKLINAITSLIDKFDSDVPDFFAEIFKFLPEELVSVMSTCLIIFLVVSVFKFIRG